MSWGVPRRSSWLDELSTGITAIQVARGQGAVGRQVGIVPYVSVSEPPCWGWRVAHQGPRGTLATVDSLFSAATCILPLCLYLPSVRPLCCFILALTKAVKAAAEQASLISYPPMSYTHLIRVPKRNPSLPEALKSGTAGCPGSSTCL